MLNSIEQCFLYSNCNHKDCNKDFCLRKYKLDHLYQEALLPADQKVKIKLCIDADGTDLDKFKQLAEIEKDIFNFVKAGKNLFIYSSTCGNGKTSWAVRMIQAYFDIIWPQSDLTCRALFIDTTAFLQALKDNISGTNPYADQIRQRALEADLVVWDDVATKSVSEYDTGNLFNLINRRIFLGKANIYTSNLSRSAMYQAVGDRLASRICDYSTEIELHGANKRKLAAQNKEAK